MIGQFRIRSLRARLIGAALLGLSISMALLGAAIETAHSASVNAARVERQIAQLYGLIAEAEESSLGLTLPIEVADPQLNQLESGRFAGVVLNRTDIPITGLRQWMTIEVRFIEFAQVYRFAA